MKILNATQASRLTGVVVDPKAVVPIQATVDELVLMEITPYHQKHAFLALQAKGFGYAIVQGFLNKFQYNKPTPSNVQLVGTIFMKFDSHSVSFIRNIVNISGLYARPLVLDDGWIQFEDKL